MAYIFDLRLTLMKIHNDTNEPYNISGANYDDILLVGFFKDPISIGHEIDIFNRDKHNHRRNIFSWIQSAIVFVGKLLHMSFDPIAYVTFKLSHTMRVLNFFVLIL